MKNQLYFDYAATTPTDPRVVSAMTACLSSETLFANASSRHALGVHVKQCIEAAREQVALAIHAEPGEIIFTSGATESNNLAIKGAARLHHRRGNHIITMTTEHKAVLDTCQHLEKHGFKVTYLQPLPNGLLDFDAFENAISSNTILVSIMHVNNEIGVIQDIERIAAITSQRNILLHVDAAQSFGKIAINVKQMPIDLISLSAHKCYGPKGIGALYLRKRPRVRVEPLLHGGGHEQGLRSGTLATHQIIGMGKAFEIATDEMHTEIKRVRGLRERLLADLNPQFQAHQLQLTINNVPTVPHIINLQFCSAIADAILAQIPMVAASTASACQDINGVEGSYVLQALGLTQQQIQGAIRFSIGRFTKEKEVVALAQQLEMILSK